jgi:diguanylate cyclase (GGDEF)-like protein
MEKDLVAEIKKLKKEYLDSERAHQDEKECLLKIINALGPLVNQPELEKPYLQIKEAVQIDKPLDLDRIEAELAKIKKNLVAQKAPGSGRDGNEHLELLQKRLMEACRSLRKVMIVLLEEFYPMGNAMVKKAAGIEVNCPEDIENILVAEPTDAFLDFLKELRARISEDFKQVNHLLMLFMNQVKELEDTLRQEFGHEDNIKRIEYFEMKINDEMGSISDSFSLFKNIDELKDTILGKINAIKQLVSKKKEEDLKKTRLVQDNIQKLKQRIIQVEKDAKEMSRKAEEFESAAMKDGLTGLYNRKAFDLKLSNVLKAFNEGGDPFALMIFDVDAFKKINDSFGHVAGDKVLKKVAQSLKETFRADDFMARYGGDEFVVIIGSLTKEMARDKIISFKARLKKKRFMSYEKGEVDVDVSTGIALALKDDTIESLIHRADQAMYQVKKNKGMEKEA